MTDAQGQRTAGETILLVEDDPPIRDLMRRMLEAHGYNVLEASCGHEAKALAEAQSAPIHLLLTDVAMPGMNGFDLVDMVIGHHPETKVLFITAHADHVAVRGGLKEARRPFLLKPYTQVDLAQKIRKVLETG